jgi:hypothetical protein
LRLRAGSALSIGGGGSLKLSRISSIGTSSIGVSSLVRGSSAPLRSAGAAPRSACGSSTCIGTEACASSIS